MATGEKLPNTNLNLIQDSDVIDNADINAIAQAVEATATGITQEWTPRLGGSNTDGTANYLSRYGVWRRIGNTVFIQARMVINSFTGASGYFVIRGLPESFAIGERSTHISSTLSSMNDLGVYHADMMYHVIYLRGEAGSGWVNAQDFTSQKFISLSGVILLNV